MVLGPCKIQFWCSEDQTQRAIKTDADPYDCLFWVYLMCHVESICLLFIGIVQTKFKCDTLVPRIFIDGDSGEIIHICCCKM